VDLDAYVAEHAGEWRRLDELSGRRRLSAHDADELVFKAIQTYSNKEVVRWIEVQADGAEEPENPAPVLALTAASENGHHGAAASNAAEKPDDAKAAAKTTEAASDVDGSDTTARVLGVVGIVVGAAGVAYGVLAGRRRTTTEA